MILFITAKALLKITWDDETMPGVLVPFGDFFYIGNSYPGNFTSLSFNVSLKPEEAGQGWGPELQTISPCPPVLSG